MKKPLFKKPKYSLTLKIAGREFKSEAETLKEALSKIKVSSGVKTISLLSIEKDGKRTDKILNPRITQALFGDVSPTTKDIHLSKVIKLYDV